MNTRSRAGHLVAAAFAVVGLATACSSGDGTTGAASAPAARVPAPTASTSGFASDAPATGELVVGGPVGTSTSPLGLIVVDGTGRTVYAYDKDTTHPAASDCYDQCAVEWPPVPATTDVAGIDSGLIGSVARKDGSQQLTVDDHPVYLFAGDKAPGDVKGQLAKGAWHAITPKGKEITKEAG
jgi:predicted lipoprotein with Yx(FWY)xxD motif